MKKLLVAVVALSGFAAFAQTYTWTGLSSDNVDDAGKWTDPKNWSVGGATAESVPGTADIAVFPSLADGAATTIDLTDAGPVGGIVVRGADAPSYVFGTSADQILRLASAGSSTTWSKSDGLYKFIVEAEVVRSQTIVAGFAVGHDLKYAKSTPLAYAGIANLSSSATVTIGNFGYVSAVDEPSGDLKTAPRGYFDVAGPGRVVVGGEPQAGNVAIGQNYMGFGNYANVLFTKSFDMSGRFDMAQGNTGEAYCRNIEIGEGVTLYQMYSNFSSLTGGYHQRWYGAGTLKLNAKAFFEMTSGAGDRRFDVHMETTGSSDSAQRRSLGLYSDAGGTFRFNNPSNSFIDRLWIFGKNGVPLHGLVAYGAKFGLKSDASSSFGAITNFVCNSGAGVGFSGSEPDTTDREFVFGDLTCYNKAQNSISWTGATELRVCADGTASFTVDSEVLHEYTDALGTNVIRLAGAGTGGGIWRKPLTDATTCYSAGSAVSRPVGTPVTVGVTKSGAGTWTLAGANTYTGDTTVEEGTLVLGADGSISSASRVVMAGGTLAVAGGATKTVNVLTASGGVSRVSVGAGATLTVTALETPTAGTVDVETEEGAAFVCPALAGQDAPVWLKMKGVGVRFDADGKAHATTVLGVTDFIPARGGIIPNKVSAIVGIASPGEGTAGPVTLAETATAISDLVMRETTVPATVDLDGGQLTVGALHVDLEAAALSVGTGTGSVAAPQGVLALDVCGASLLGVFSPLDASVTTVTKTGPGEAKLEGETAYAGQLVVSNGTLAVGGSFTVDPKNMKTANRSAAIADAPTVRICDGAAIRLAEADAKSTTISFVVGGDQAEAYNYFGRMVVTNASLKVPESVATADLRRSFYVGCKNAGELVIEDGADVSGTFVVGSTNGRGVIRQNGGNLCFVGSGWNGVSFIGFAAAYGAYVLNGGTATYDATVIFGYNPDSPGVLEQQGGTLNASTLSFGFGKDAFGAGHLTGGTTTASELAVPRRSSDCAFCDGVLTIEKSAVMTCTSSLYLGSGTNSTTGTLVLGTGGKLTANVYIYKYATIQTDFWQPDTSYAALAFDGGTLAFTGTANNPFSDEGKRIDDVIVYDGGATVEVPSGETVGVSKSFDRPSGGGVASVPWEGPMTEYDFLAPPSVQIKGDGRGAVAVADWDEANRRVTGIRVTAPGCGYTQAMAYIHYGRKKEKGSSVNDGQEVACTLTGDVQPSGDFTKVGGGTLTFNAANTYGGKTVLKGGTLKAGVKGAIPAGSKVVLAGGALELDSGVEAPTFALDALGSFESDGAFAFPEGAQVEVLNLDQVTEETEPHWIVQYKGGVTGSPVIVNAGDVPKGWKVRRVAKGFKLARETGLMLLVR